MANPTYFIAGELGKGGFGVVYLLKSDKDGPPVSKLLQLLFPFLRLYLVYVAGYVMAVTQIHRLMENIYD